LLKGIVVMIKKRTLNRLATQFLDISELGFGTAPLGNLYKPISDDEANDALEDAWDAGIRYYDTAPLYGLGLSETRLNRFLRTKPRSEYILSSKVGRLMARSEEADRTGIGKWFNVPSRKERYDYSYDGVMRSVEFSYERLGVNKIDILYVHDLCVFTHGSKKASEERVTEFFQNGGYAAMLKLREEGVVSAIGGGINEWEVCQTLAERGDFDIFLLAGRYTLLEQTATGPVKGAFYNYDTASQSIIDRVAAIERVCTSHGVSLKAAALQFPLLHSTHLSVVPGAQSAEELNNNLEVYKAVIPSSLWSDLKAEGLLRQDAPVA
jgi:D-threo-aldose 1-dehydrogenase